MEGTPRGTDLPPVPNHDAATEFAQELVWLFEKASGLVDVPEEFGRAVENARTFLARQSVSA